MKHTSGCQSARPSDKFCNEQIHSKVTQTCNVFDAKPILQHIQSKIEAWAQTVGMLLVQDSVGNERRLHGENRATGGGNLAKLYSGLHAAASALELSWLV